MNSKPKSIDEGDRHPVAGGKRPHMKSRLEELKDYAPPMWPMVGYDPAHTGQCPHDTSCNVGFLKWRYKSHCPFSPVVGADGTVYLGDSEMLQALRPDG